MAIDIFKVDPTASAPRDNDELVGRFRSGAQVQGRPMALSEWRVTTGDPEVADAIAERFGGTPAQWETTTEENLEIYTTVPHVEIIVDSPSAVVTKMVLWGRKGMIRKCDGVTQEDGSACVCPQTVKERKEADDAGTGCAPSIMIFFRLAEDPDLGKFRFMSGSWSMAKEIGDAEEALVAIEGPALCRLKLVPVEYETKAGVKRNFTKPVLEVVGPAEDAPFPKGDA